MAEEVDFKDMMNFQVPDGSVLQAKREGKTVWRRPFRLTYDGLVLTRGATSIGSNNPVDWTNYTDVKKYGYIDGESNWMSDYYRFNEDFVYALPEGLSVYGYEFVAWLDKDDMVQVSEIDKGSFRNYNLSAFFVPTDHIVKFYDYNISKGGFPLEPDLVDAEVTNRKNNYYQEVTSLYVPWGFRIQDAILKDINPDAITFGDEGEVLSSGTSVYYNEEAENGDGDGDGDGDADGSGGTRILAPFAQQAVDTWCKYHAFVTPGAFPSHTIGSNRYDFLQFDPDLSEMPQDDINVYSIYSLFDAGGEDLLDGLIPFEILVWTGTYNDVPLQEGWYEITCVGSGGSGDAGRK